MRDGQKQKVYDAEWRLRTMLDNTLETGNPVVELNGIHLTLPPEARFANLESIQAYVDKVLALPEITALELPWAMKVRVRERRGDKFAHYERYAPAGPTIAIPMGLGSFALRETIVLHELAHHLAPAHLHGPVFAAAYIALVGTVMAPEMALAQRILYDQGGVEVK